MRRWSLSLLITVIAMALIAPAAMAKKKKKSDEPPAPEPGAWFDYHGVQCYQPPAFAAESNEPKKRMLRQNAMEAMLALMRGEINEQFVVDERKIDDWETDFLGKPVAIEPFLVENLAKCKTYAEGELGLKAYADWVASGGRRATAGDCHNPLTYELHQTMTVQDGWQVRRHMCKQDQVLIETSETNRYTVADTGDYATTAWINPTGNCVDVSGAEPVTIECPPALTAVDPATLPCPDCPWGAVVYRFENEETGDITFGTLGSSMEFKSEFNGWISFTVNDVTYYDNTFHEANGVIDYLPLSIYPPVLGIDDGGQ